MLSFGTSSKRLDILHLPMKKLLALGGVMSLLVALVQAQPFQFKTGDFALSISDSGQLLAFRDPAHGQNYLAAGQKAALLRLRVGEVWLEPAQARFEEPSGVLELTYADAKETAWI